MVCHLCMYVCMYVLVAINTKTRIYIVKYRQSIAFCYFYIVGHFSVARVGESHKQTSDSRTSRRLSSF